MTKLTRLLGILAAVFVIQPLAHATDPSIRYHSGPVISPAAATTYYTGQPGGLNSGAARVLDDPRLVELARALEGDANLIDEFIRRNIRTTPHFGLQKGSVGAVLDRAAGPLDQAQLMVDLIRAGGGTARYARGTATLSAADARAAFGLPASVDIVQALANGGIPVSGGSGQVTFFHFWVQVQTPAGWVSYDPALKLHENLPPANLASLAGLDAGGFRSRALSGSTSGTESGIPWRSGLNWTNIENDLSDHAVRFLNAMRGPAYQSSSLTDVVGGVRLIGDPMVVPAGASHPFAGNPAATFNEVPNALRTQLRVRVPSAQIDVSFFVDQYAGRRITLKWDAQNGFPCTEGIGNCADHQGTQFRARLFAGHTNLAQIDDSQWTNTDGLLGTQTSQFVIATGIVQQRDALLTLGSSTPQDILLDLTSPYAGSSGNHGNLSYQTSADPRSQTELIVAGGTMLRHHAVEYAHSVRSHRLRAYYDSDHTFDEYDYVNSSGPSPNLIGTHPDAEQMYGMELWFQGLEIALDRDILWREWVASRDHTLPIFDGVNRTWSSHQFTLGVATGANPAWIDAVTHLTVINAEPSGNVASTQMGYAFISSMIEEQVITTAFARSVETNPGTGQWTALGRSGATSFGRSGTSGTVRFYHFNSGQSIPAILSGRLGIASPLVQDQMSSGSSVFAGIREWSPGQFVPTHGLVSSKAGHLGVLVMDGVSTVGTTGNRLRKGGGVSVPELPSPDFVRTMIENPGLRVLDVDLRTGAFSRSSGPDVVAGGGAFPYSLPFQRSYSSMSQSMYPLGLGWTHNWDLYASIGASAYQITMEDDPVLMAPTVAVALLMQVASSWADPLERHIAVANLATIWSDKYVNRSTVTVHLGGSSELFVRLADGAYRGARNSQSTLTELPGGGGSYPVPGGETVDYLYRGPAGDMIRFEPVTASDLGVYTTNGRDSGDLKDKFHATLWSFPYGMAISFTYRPHTGTLQSVTNTLGWSLEFESVNRICIEGWHPSVPPYEVETACKVLSGRYRLIDSVGARAPGGAGIHAATFHYQETGGPGAILSGSPLYPTLMHRATTPATGSGEIRYRYGVHGGMTLVPPSVSHVALTEIFDPLDTTTPAMRIYYSDGQGILPSRVNRVSVRASSGYVDYNYFVSGDRGAYRDPANAVFASHYDLDGRLDRVIDPVGRATASTFDGAGRVIETRTYEHPNRNAYVARTTFAYDDRSNPIQEIVHPRINPATGLPFANPPLVTSREFHVVWNRPIRIIDPRGSESTITYHPTTGLVLSEAGPSGEVVTYQYNTFGQVTRVEVEAGQ